jgi:L-alanine-DL-glutamate epimerase-like enolase superfamily enzyme
MKIVDIKTAVVEGNFDWTFVRVYTDEGITGIGESFLAPGLTSIIRDLKPLLIGEDPRNIDRLFRKMQLHTAVAGSVYGIGNNAISGVETALWDILGKSLNAPVYRLLGGQFRSRIRVYADCHAGKALGSLGPVLTPRKTSWTTEPKEDEPIGPEDYACHAREMMARGFTALKFDIPEVDLYPAGGEFNRCLSTRNLDRLLNLVCATREAVGRDFDLAFDIHWQFNANDGLKFALGCEPYNLLWLEDPIPPENIDVLAALTHATRTPICSGENLSLRQGFRTLIEKQAVNIVSPDFQKAGGVLEGRRIADLADTYYIAVAPHNISSPIGTIASAHIAAAIPNFLALEFHASEVPFWEDLATGIQKPIIREGYISLSEAPGLGIDLNEEVARTYAKPGEPFFA